MSKSSFPLAIFLCVLSSNLAFVPDSEAVDYYLQANQGSTSNWETITGSGGWYDAASGGAHPALFDPAGDYFNNGFTLRGPTSADTFGGNSITISSGTFLLRGTGTATLGILNSTGANIQNGIGTSTTPLQVALFHNTGTTILRGDAIQARPINLSIGTLTGNGDFTTNQITTLTLSITNATAYSGSILHSSGRINFNSDVVSGGGLVVDAGTTFTLDQQLTFASLTIAGDSLLAGTYSYGFLNSTYGSIFDTGSALSSITVVPEPSALSFLMAGVTLLGLLQRRPRRFRNAAKNAV